jgi:HNH endonuclease
MSNKPRGKLGICFYCEDERALTIDHYVPIGRGGSNDPRNLVPACVACNTMKADLLSDEFFWYCKEISEGMFPQHQKFASKAKKIIFIWAPDLLKA